MTVQWSWIMRLGLGCVPSHPNPFDHGWLRLAGKPVALITQFSFLPVISVRTLDDTSIAKAKASKGQGKEWNSKGTRKIRITGKSNG